MSDIGEDVGTIRYSIHAPDVRRDDTGRWQIIDQSVEQLAGAHAELRKCSSDVRELQELQLRQFEQNDDGYGATTALLAELMPRKKQATSKVEASCLVLNQQAEQLRRLVDPDAMDSLALLRDVDQLTREAQSSSECVITDSLRRVTAAIRAQLRAARTQKFREVLEEIKRVCGELESLGETADATVLYLETERYLDIPLEEGRLHLDNELSIVTRRVEQLRAEARRRDAVSARDALNERLQGAYVSESGLASLVELMGVAANLNEEERRPLGESVLKAIAAAEAPLSSRVKHWVRAAAYIWGAEAGFTGLSSVAALLPQTCDEKDSLNDHAETLLLEAGCDNQDPFEGWVLVEKLSEANPNWAEAFFRVLWGNNPDIAPTARWFLIAGKHANPSPAQVERLASNCPPHEQWALGAWAEAIHKICVLALKQGLFEVWLRRQLPFPALDALEDSINESHTKQIPLFDVLRTVISLMSGEEVSGGTAASLRLLKGTPFAQVGTACELMLKHGRPALKRRAEERTKARKATSMLDELHGQRNPASQGTLWTLHVFPIVDRLRHQAGVLATRAAALSELDRIRPEKLIENCLAEHRQRGINPSAKEMIGKYIETYQDEVPLEHAELDRSANDAPSPDFAKLDEELTALESEGAVGEVASRLLRGLLNEASPTLVRGTGASLSKTARETYAAALDLGGAPLFSWRFQTSSEQNWHAAAGQDVLARLSGTLTVQEALRSYAKLKHFEHALDLATTLPEAERDAVREEILRERQAATNEVRAMIESFLLIPLNDALRGFSAAIEPDLSRELEALHEKANALMDRVDEIGPRKAEVQIFEIVPSVERATEANEGLAASIRHEVEMTLNGALWRGLKGEPVVDTSILARAFGEALQGRVLESRQTLRLLLLPPNDPARLAALQAATAAHPPAIENLVVPAARLRPVEPVRLEDLNRYLRMSWDKATVPESLEVASDPHNIQMGSFAEHHEIVLYSAKKLWKEGRGEFRLWLANWAIDEGFKQVDERNWLKAREHAHDAAYLLAGAASADLTRWTMDAAIVLWLASALEGGAIMSRSTVPWERLRADAGVGLIGTLVRRFFESRAVDIFSELIVEAALMGGHVLPRILSGLDTREHHMRGLLIREILRGGVTLTQARIAAAVDVMTPLVDSGGLSRVEEVLSECVSKTPADWAMNDAMAAIFDTIRDAGLPESIQTHIAEAFHFRAYVQSGGSLKREHFSLSLATSLVYLSASEADPRGFHLVAVLHYESGMASARDLKVSIAVEHTVLSVVASARTQQAAHIRPGESHEFLFPLQVAPAHSRHEQTMQPAIVTLLLYRENVAGFDEAISKKMVKVNVALVYPHQDASTPYITGKCVSTLSMIKGRDKEVNDILRNLHGKNEDNFVLIYGMRRIGKSSLLQKLRLDERIRRHYSAVHLDLEDLVKMNMSVGALIQKFAARIRENIEHADARELPAEISETNAYDEFRQYLQRIAATLGSGRRLLLLFDEFQMLLPMLSSSGDSLDTQTSPYSDLIRSIRHWIQYTPVSFIVTGTNELKKAILEPKERLFQLGLAIELQALDEKAAHELISEPVKQYYKITYRAAIAIAYETGRLPSLIQIVCHELFSRMLQRHQTVATLHDVMEIFDGISRKDEHFSFLLSPISHNADRRSVVRALAEIANVDKRGSIQDITDHLKSYGHDRLAVPEVVESHVKALDEQHLIATSYVGKTKSSSHRLKPPLLSRHVLKRKEYDL